MEIYDLCGNERLASGVYQLEFIGAAGREAVKILKFAAFGLTHVARRRKFYRGSVVVAQQWRRCACALRAALAAWGRERRGRLCGACYGGSSNSGEVKQ